MKLSMPLVYAGNPRETADQVVGLEKAGLDLIWVAEPYGFGEIVRDVAGGKAFAGPQLDQIVEQQLAGLAVERRKRFIHQHDGGID